MKNVVKQKKFCEILLPLPFVKASDEGKTVLDLTINPHILMAAGDLKQLRFLFDYCERFFNGLSMAVCVTKISKYDRIQEEYGFNLTTRGTYDLRNPLKVKDFYESMSDRLEEMKKFNVRDFCDLKFKRKSLQNYLSPQDKRSPANLEEFEKFIRNGKIQIILVEKGTSFLECYDPLYKDFLLKIIQNGRRAGYFVIVGETEEGLGKLDPLIKINLTTRLSYGIKEKELSKVFHFHQTLKNYDRESIYMERIGEYPFKVYSSL